MSGCMALSVMAVSTSVSPLRMDDEFTDMFMTSAPGRMPASSNEDWVGVEGYKNRLTWVRPRNDARFFSIWRLRVTNSSARSSSPTISSGESPSIPNRCRWWRTKDVFGAMFIKAGAIGTFGGARKGALETVHRVLLWAVLTLINAGARAICRCVPSDHGAKPKAPPTFRAADDWPKGTLG